MLYEEIREKIRSGELGPGTKVPSVRETALRRGLSEPTVYRALRELVSSGLVAPRQGKGFFVTGREEISKKWQLASPAGRIVEFDINSRQELLRHPRRNGEIYPELERQFASCNLKFEILQFPSEDHQIEYIFDTLDREGDAVTGMLVGRLAQVEASRVLLQKLIERKMPVVVTCGVLRAEMLGLSSVDVDAAACGTLAMEYLIERHVKKAAIVGRRKPRIDQAWILTVNALCAWQYWNLPRKDCVIVRTKDVFPPAQGTAAGYILAERATRQNPDIDGWFCTDYLTGLGVCAFLREHNRVPGKEIPVVINAVSAVPEMTHVPPGCLLIKSPNREMVREIVAAMRERIAGNLRPRRIRLAPDLYIVPDISSESPKKERRCP